jgi:hypothetical protein
MMRSVIRRYVDIIEAKDAEIARLNRVIEVEALNYAMQHDEIERLRTLLRDILTWYNGDQPSDAMGRLRKEVEGKIARKALEGK